MMNDFALAASSTIIGVAVSTIFYWLSGRDLRKEAAALRAETRKSRQVVNALAGWLKYAGVADVRFDANGDV